MPREINVGYVIAMPKFTRTLKAVRTNRIRSSYKMIFMGNRFSIKCMLRVTSFHTKKQACHPTEVGPGEVLRRANVLHACEIQDDRHEADEDKVGASDDAQKERGLSKFGAAQDHLEEHLTTEEDRNDECTKTCALEEHSRHCRGRTCKLIIIIPPCPWHWGLLPSVDHIRQHRQQDRGDERPRVNMATYPVASLIRTRTHHLLRLSVHNLLLSFAT